MQNEIDAIKECLKKVESIKTEFDKYKSESDVVRIKDSSITIPSKELEFKHLVYRYNPNLPLNNHLKDVVFKHGYFPSHHSIIAYVEFINFFISYLKEDIDILEKQHIID